MPLVESFTFDRRVVRRRVEQRVEAFLQGYRQNLGIVAPKGYGKTYLLNLIHRELCSQPSLLVVYVKAESLNLDHFIERWTGAFLASLIAVKTGSFPASMHGQEEELRSFFPKSFAVIDNVKKMLRKGEKNASTLKELFSLSSVVADETGRKVVFMMDEFHAFENLPISDPFALLGKQIMVDKETFYLVASSLPERAYEIFHNKLSLLFGNFEALELAPLSFHEMEDYLYERQPGYAFSLVQRKFLLALSGGIPAYLDLFLDQLGICFPVSHSENQDPAFAAHEIPTETLILAILRELYDRRGRISLTFEKKLQACCRFSKDSAPYIHSLLAISAGKRKLIQISSFIGRPARETKNILERLVREEVISKRGAFFLIEDFLFRFWLQEVFLRKNYMLTPNTSLQSGEVLGALQKAFEKIQLDDASHVVARIESLFKEFHNDRIEIDHKLWVCSQFSDVLIKTHQDSNATVLAKNDKGWWFCQLTQRLLKEDDVLQLIEERKKLRKKVQRTVMIALGGIEQNAKLMAQEAKIYLWDVRNLNLLLDLYNLPKLILTPHVHENKSVSVEAGSEIHV